MSSEDALATARSPISPTEAELIFDSTLVWLRDVYLDYRFYVERDIVWTVQRRLVEQVRTQQLPLLVLHHHQVPARDGRRTNADLVITDADLRVLVAAEFKFEPAHRRSDFLPSKLPVCSWEAIVRDIERSRAWVESGVAEAAFSVLIDEGHLFGSRPPIDGTVWETWSDSGPWVLIGRFRRGFA